MKATIAIYLAIGFLLVVRAAFHRRRYKRLDLEEAATLIGMAFLWLPVAIGEVREWIYHRRKQAEWLRDYINNRKETK